MTTLAANLSNSATSMRVNAAVTNPAPYYQIDSEIVQLMVNGTTVQAPAFSPTRTLDATLLQIERGISGTTKAAHLSGATLTAVYDPSVGGGAGGMDVTGQSGGSVSAATALSTPGTVVESSPGVAAVGGSVVVVAADPGAIGPGNLWLQVVFGDGNGDGGYGRLWVRNSTDDGWNTGGPMSFNSATGTVIASPDDVAELGVFNSGMGSYLYGNVSLSLSGGGHGILLDAGGIHVANDASKPVILSGSVDPSAGAGVVAPISSIYLLSTGGVGSFWQKTGAGDTAWVNVTAEIGSSALESYQAAGEISIAAAVNQDLGLGTSGTGNLNLFPNGELRLRGARFEQAAFVANGSTVDQLRDALIAAGLMAAS